MNNPGAGPLSGVPLRGEFRQIPDEPLMIDCPSRGASLAERTGASQFDTVSISGRVDLVLVKHTPMESGKTSGVYKDDRPVSFMSVPSAGYKWQVMNKVSTVWCSRFDGSTIEDFLEHLF